MSTTGERWLYRRGELDKEGWQSVVDESATALEHAGLRIAELDPGEILALTDTGIERIVIPLAGSFSVTHREDGASTVTSLRGRKSVFDGPTDVLYLSASTTLEVRGQGRVAIAESRTDDVHATRYISRAESPIELRGAGASSRQVHNFGTPQTLSAARLIVCEVITPSGNWSSYPPHKHDQNIPGHESHLEEIYYFEAESIAAKKSSGGEDSPFGLFSTYSSPAGSIEINAMVHTGDVALVPYGYHGPAVAAPGYDLYYLNVMAGPDLQRVWQISDDPAHAWVRETWAGQETDARLPYTAERIASSENKTTSNTKGPR